MMKPKGEVQLTFEWYDDIKRGKSGSDDNSNDDDDEEEDLIASY